jgi:hypothetical protein
MGRKLRTECISFDIMEGEVTKFTIRKARISKQYCKRQEFGRHKCRGEQKQIKPLPFFS